MPTYKESLEHDLTAAMYKEATPEQKATIKTAFDMMEDVLEKAHDDVLDAFRAANKILEQGGMSIALENNTPFVAICVRTKFDTVESVREIEALMGSEEMDLALDEEKAKALHDEFVEKANALGNFSCVSKNSSDKNLAHMFYYLMINTPELSAEFIRLMGSMGLPLPISEAQGNTLHTLTDEETEQKVQ